MSRTLICLMVFGLLMAGCAGLGAEDPTPTPTTVPTATSFPTQAPLPTATPVLGYVPRDPLQDLVACEDSESITMDVDLQGAVFFEVGTPGGQKTPVRAIRIVACIRDGVSEDNFGEKMMPAIDDFLKIAELEMEQFVLAAESVARWHLQKSGYGSFSTIKGEETSLYVDVYSYYPIEGAV